MPAATRSPLRALVPVLLAVGCAVNPDPVPVTGSAEDVQLLAGEWAGEYGSSQTGRSGSIIFQLEAGRDTASGDVLMIPRGSGNALHPMHGPDVTEASIPAGQMLAIQFVGVSGGQVRGALQPYHDPECDCALHTTFTGRVYADSAGGTFETEHAGTGRRTSGWWRVARR